MIKRKNIILSFLITVLALVGLIVLCVTAKVTKAFPVWVGFLVSIVIFEASNYLASKTCRCPHCKAGGYFTAKLRFSFKAMKGVTTVECPNCKKEIKIE
ncbi:MAG: hypothetical protein ACI4W6_08005 [Acutalibacteraceae bacterium]